MDPGDPFDASRHAESIDRMREFLYDAGFLRATVSPKMSIDESQNVVDVCVHIDRGEVHTVQAVEVLAESAASDDPVLFASAQELVESLAMGQPCTKNVRAEVIRALRTLYVDHGFFHAQVRCEFTLATEGALLRVTVVPSEHRPVIFEGNSAFSRIDLLREISTLGAAVLFVPVHVFSDTLIKFYRAEGFFSVQCHAEEKNDVVTLRIAEGVCARLRALVFHGVTAFSEQRVQEMCGTIIENGQPLTERARVRLREALIDLYASEGYWDVQISDEELRCIDASAGVYDIIFSVREGAQKFLRRVHAPDVPNIFSDSVWQARGDAADAVPFARKDLDAQRRLLTYRLQDQGYPYVQARPQFVNHGIPDAGAGQVVDVLWDIKKPVHAVRVGTIKVRCNGPIRTDIIARELAFAENDFWDAQKLQQSSVRLKELDVFSHVAITPADEIDAQGRRDVTVHVVTDDPHELFLRGGMQWVGGVRWIDALTYRLGGSFAWKNPTHAADSIELTGEVTRFRWDGSVAYERPVAFWRPATVTGKVYATSFDQPVYQGVSSRLYRLFKGGGLVSFDHGVDRGHTAVTAGVEWMQLSRLSKAKAQAISFSSDLINEFVPYVFVEPSWMASHVDDAAYPHSGMFAVASAKFMQPLHKDASRSLRVLGEYAHFIPIHKQVVGAVRVRAGYIFYKNFSEIMASERFYLGGGYSVRCCGVDLVPPLGVYTTARGRKIRVPIGGKAMVQGSAELRFPVYRDIGAVLFSDCGMLAQADIVAEFPRNVVLGAGFGLRYQTPVGPVRFDIGWMLNNRHEGLPNYAWFLTLGHAF